MSEKQVSLKKIEANRRNALRSTGPKTPAGKARVRLNALTHGLLSREIVLPDEDQVALAQLARRLRVDLQPIGEREELLADLVTRAVWRLRRFGRVEAEVFVSHGTRLLDTLVDRVAEADGTVASVGLVFIRDATGPDAFSKLSRYEARVERSLYRALHELERLQHARRGGAVPPPLAVDLDVSGLAGDVGEERVDA